MLSYQMYFTLSMFVFIFVICVNRVTYLLEGCIVFGHSRRVDRDMARGTLHTNITYSLG